jgi:Mg/Co/Ni transporter MgtE
MSHIVINWNALLRAAGVSIAIGVTLICVFTVGVLGYVRIDDPDATPQRRSSGFVLAGAALAVIASAAMFGVYLLIPSLH